MNVDTIRANCEKVLDEIERSRKRSRFSASKVNLVVVTKAQPVEIIQSAYLAGVRMFGENYPEETIFKIGQLGDLPGASWHMIGHLQSRKARFIAESFDMMHSVDGLDIAKKLNERLVILNRILPILIEVNVSGEETKHGFNAENSEKWVGLLPEFQQIIQLPNLNVMGLMTMPPLQPERESSRPYFTQLRNLQTYLRKTLPTVCWDELSMGTSFDFGVAVEEGATFVRVGTAIVGERLNPGR